MSDTSYMVHDYPDPPAEPVPLECAYCGFAIGDEVFELDGQAACGKCFDEYVSNELSRDEAADALGVEHWKKEDYLSRG